MRLHVLVFSHHQSGQGPVFFLCEKDFRVLLLCPVNDDVGNIKNRLGTSVVLFQFNHLRVRKHLRKIHDVSEIGPSKCIDTLRVISHHHHVVVRGGKEPDNIRLNLVRVLVFIDHDVLVGLR